MAARIDRALQTELAKTDFASTRRSLIKAGVAERTIEHRVSTGSLVAFPCGVVGSANPPNEYRQRCRAALLGVTGSALGFDTAAALHELPVARDAHVHLVVPHGTHHAHAGITVHQTRRLAPVDTALAGGFMVTSIARTLVDLAATTGGPRLRWLCEFVIKEGLVSAAELSACIAQFSRRRPGLPLAFSTVAPLGELIPIEASALETLFQTFAAEVGLAGLVEQFSPPWFDGIRGTVDFAIPDLKIIIEVDGRRWHSLTQDMESDRQRDRSAIAEGWVVLRITWDELTQRSDDVAADIFAVISDRSTSAA